MKQTYRLKPKSLISTRLVYIIIIFLAIFLGYKKGVNGMLVEAEKMGGLWPIILLVFLSFGETFYNLVGHRLEINNEYFCFKTLTGTLWSYPVSSIQTIEPHVRTPESKRPFFVFQSDNKIFQCDYEPTDYPKLLSDLKALNPNISIKDIQLPMGRLETLGRTPINQLLLKFSKNKNGETGWLIKSTSLHWSILMSVLLLVTILVIFGIVYIQTNFGFSIL